MKLRTSLFNLIFIVLPAVSFAGVEETFEVKFVGSSNNTNTVFIDSTVNATKSNCDTTNHFKLPIDDQLADKFYSAAMAAKMSGKKLAINYEPDECIHGAILVKVFKLVD